MRTHLLDETMNIADVWTGIKGMSERTHKHFDTCVGKRGGHNTASDFDMGAYAAIDTIMDAIENNDITIMEKWLYRE
jgi:hypothetical protein